MKYPDEIFKRQDVFTYLDRQFEQALEATGRLVLFHPEDRKKERTRINVC